MKSFLVAVLLLALPLAVASDASAAAAAPSSDLPHCGEDADGHMSRGCGEKCREEGVCTLQPDGSEVCPPGVCPLKECPACRFDPVPCCFGGVEPRTTATALGVCTALAALLTLSIMLLGWWTKPPPAPDFAGGQLSAARMRSNH